MNALTLRLPVVVLAAFLLAAGSAGTLPLASAAGPSPDGVARVAAATERLVLFEGADRHAGEWFVDGRVWLYDRAEGRLHLLTRSRDFGDHFFAEAALLLPGRDAALVLVNFDDDAANLFLVGLDGGPPRLLVDAGELGLAELRSDSFVLAPDGERVVFRALASRRDPAARHGVLWEAGVYSFDPAAADPEATLRLEPPGAGPAAGRSAGSTPARWEAGRLLARELGLAALP